MIVPLLLAASVALTAASLFLPAATVRTGRVRPLNQLLRTTFAVMHDRELQVTP
jgi:hypothetical protein